MIVPKFDPTHLLLSTVKLHFIFSKLIVTCLANKSEMDCFIKDTSL